VSVNWLKGICDDTCKKVSCCVHCTVLHSSHHQYDIVTSYTDFSARQPKTVCSSLKHCREDSLSRSPAVKLSTSGAVYYQWHRLRVTLWFNIKADPNTGATAFNCLYLTNTTGPICAISGRCLLNRHISATVLTDHRETRHDDVIIPPINFAMPAHTAALR